MHEIALKIYVPWFVCIYALAENVHAAWITLSCAVFAFTVFVQKMQKGFVISKGDYYCSNFL